MDQELQNQPACAIVLALMPNGSVRIIPQEPALTGAHHKASEVEIRGLCSKTLAILDAAELMRQFQVQAQAQAEAMQSQAIAQAIRRRGNGG